MADFFRILFTTSYGLIILVNVVIYFIPEFGLANRNTLEAIGANNGVLIRSGEYWRLISSQFLHANLLHLFFNMYFIYSIGDVLVEYFDRLIPGNPNVNFLLIYIFAGVCGGLASGFLGQSFSIGASGAVFGLLGALLIVAFKTQNSELQSMVFGNLVINFIFGLSVPRIDMLAHGGGFVGGMLITYLFMLI